MREPSNHGESAPPAPPENFETYVRRKLIEHDVAIEEINTTIGREGSEVKKLEPTGLHRFIDELKRDLKKELEQLARSVDQMTKAVSDFDASRKAEADALAKKREPWSWALKLAIGTIITSAVVAGLAAFGAWVARHWIP